MGKQIFKKIIIPLFCLLMTVLLVPETVKAYTSNFETDNEGYKLIHTYEELKTAALYATVDEKFRLANDIEQIDSLNSNYVVVNQGYFYLDLNGYTVERKTASLDHCLFRISNESQMFISDSSANQTGTCRFTNDAGRSYYVIAQSDGLLEIYGGNFVLGQAMNYTDSAVLHLESGQTNIYDGVFDSRAAHGESLELNQYYYMISTPHCNVFGGKFYSYAKNIDICPNGHYLKYGSTFATVYVMGGEFYLEKQVDGAGGFSYCNNGWGNVYVADGIVPRYSLNDFRDVEYLNGAYKQTKQIAIAQNNLAYSDVSGIPSIVTNSLNYQDRLLAKCLSHELNYIKTDCPKSVFYTTNQDAIDSLLKQIPTSYVGSYDGESPKVSIEGLAPGDHVEWYGAYDYDGETATWQKLNSTLTQSLPWQFDIRPDEETTYYIRALVTRADGSEYEDVLAIHYSKFNKVLQGNAKIYMNNPHYGNNVYAGIFDAPSWQDKSTYTYEWKLDGVVVGTEERFSIDKESYVGKKLSCTIKSSKYQGVLVTPEMTVLKAKNTGTPFFPSATYNATEKSINLTSLKADQEYLFTPKDSLEDLTENDWVYAKQPSDSTGAWKLSYVDLQNYEGQTVYIYTRMKETGTHRAGEKVYRIPLLLADQIYLKNITFPQALNGTIYLPYTQKGEQVEIAYNMDPFNANQWSNLYWRTLSSSVATLVSPSENVTPQNNTGTVRLQLQGTGSTALQAYYKRYTEEVLANVNILVYDPENPSLGTANVVTPLPDRTQAAGTTFVAELPEFIPEPPQSIELFWYLTNRTQYEFQTFTDCEVASINPSTGEIIAKAPGTVNVSLLKTTENGYYELDTFVLTVVEPSQYVYVEQILLDKTSITIEEQKTAYLGAVVLPDNATNKDKVWSSSDPSVVTVDQNGMIRGISSGTATITVKADYKSARCQVTVTKNILNSSGSHSELMTNPFHDVYENTFYYEPVLWAVTHGITTGFSSTVFGPELGCSRAQAMTFLWRAYGQPEPISTHNPFTDVPSSEYFYKAVLWAYENNITTGTTPTTFSPHDICTRDQIVTLIWRSVGSPSPAQTSTPFTDIDSNLYYYQAVLWAVENQITTGTTPTTFEPTKTCTRAEIVTFLYRFMEGK